jgi:hypothetical protein
MPTRNIKLRRIYEVAERLVLYAGAVVLVLWAVSPTRKWLEGWLLFDSASISALVGFLLVILYKTLFGLEKAIERAGESGSTRLLTGGVNEVYPVLSTLIFAANTQHRRERRPRELEVLGLTLFTAWPYLEGVLSGRELDGWSVRLLCLDPEFIRACSPTISAGWAHEAASKVEQIRDYVEYNRAELDRRKVSIELRTYSCPPGVHGFRVAGRDVLLAVTHWGADNRFRPPYDFYEHVPLEDETGRAGAYRGLFENWISHARACSSLSVSSRSSAPP